jgi:phosphohistidine phosphatase
VNIFLLRHGEAMERGFEDSVRPLTPHGREQSKIVAETFKTLGITPREILTSPIQRARETADIVAQELGLERPAASELMLPGSDLRKLLEILRLDEASSVLLVGHEPHLSTLTSILINGTTYSHIAIGKGSLLNIEGQVPIERGKCRLLWLFTQEEMRYLKK